MNPPLTVIKMVTYNYYSFYVSLLCSCVYANKNYLIYVNPNTLLNSNSWKIYCTQSLMIRNSRYRER